MKKTLLFLLLFCAFYGLNAQFKLTQDFSSETFPPTGWNRGDGVTDDTGDPIWTRSASSAYSVGAGSAFCYFYAWSGGTTPIDSLISPVFTSTAAGDTLYFDHAHRSYSGENDYTKIYTSTDGGATWTLLIDLPGNGAIGTGTVTANPSTSNFLAPTTGQWLSKKFVLGAGINRIKFEVETGYGNNLFLDNIKVGTPPSIDAAVISVGTTGSVYALSGGSIIPTGTVQNNGGSDATFNVTRTISPGGYVSTKTVTALAPTATQVVNFDSWNYSVNTVYTIKDSLFLAGDVNPANDTLSGLLMYETPKSTLILNVGANRSRDSLVSHLNLAGLGSDFQQTTVFPGIALANWRTLIVLAENTTCNFSAALVDSLTNYLAGASDPVNKRTMLIFGNDIGYYKDPRRNGAATTADTVFYRQYLRAQYWSDAWTTNFPLSDSTLTGITSPFTTITGQRVNDPYPDNISPAFWNGETIAALVPITESGDGDSCGAVAHSTTNYEVFYGSNMYYGYVPTVSGALSPQGVVFNVIRQYVEQNGGQLPVELASFTSSIDNRKVTLNWSTTEEINNAGFDIERKASNEILWKKIGNVTGSGNSNVTRDYSFSDNNLNTGKYNYRLKQVDYNGNFEYFNLANEVNIGVPMKFALSQNYPNPFNPATKINYDLPFDSKVAIKVFDITGREITSLVNQVQVAGYHTISFNAANLSSGVYFYTITADGGNQSFMKTMKMVLIK